ncbi:hypothetical protein EZ449_12290 [Pedobacter frigidisoli]|uniref:Fimbrial assembly protein (PilN) n=1 Tax=Pedobacter frigidisoli TaxID=2530455 RepID=A0A4R0P3F6_9SPHI|nr:hypothetical protein [Pedobacter frigidisoli]TCD08612.1 hypothetical protein EZ449_12290 [Pedobacter frigidisoli]
MWKVSSFEQVLGLEIRILEENQYDCRFSIVEKRGDKLELISSKQFEGNLVQMLEKLPRKFPVALSISGKGIVHRNLPINESAAANNFGAAFPAVEVRDFYVQEFLADQAIVVSIARKVAIDSLLEKFSQAGLNIICLSLGGMASHGIWEMSERDGNEIDMDGHHILLSDQGKFLSYHYSPKLEKIPTINVAKTAVPLAQMVAYGSTLQLFLHENMSIVKADVMIVDDAFEKYVDTVHLKKMGLIYLISLFALLLISFMAYNYYNSKNATLAERAGQRSNSSDHLASLQQNIAKNEQLLEHMNWNGGYNYGFLLNEIGRGKPRQITLSSISFDEAKAGEVKKSRSPEIQVSGLTDNLLAVNNWIFLLKETKWVKGVKLLRYQDHEEDGDYSFTFLINY